MDRIRNGRSFVTRRVVARQSDGAILNLACSFQLHEKQADIQESKLPDDVGEPGSGTVEDWELLGRRVAHQSVGRSAIWLKVFDDLGDDRVKVHGVTGGPRTDFLKVSIAYSAQIIGSLYV